MVDTSYYTVSEFQCFRTVNKDALQAVIRSRRFYLQALFLQIHKNLNKLSLLFCFYDDYSFPDVLKDDLKSIEFLLQFKMITPFLMS